MSIRKMSEEIHFDVLTFKDFCIKHDLFFKMDYSENDSFKTNGWYVSLKSKFGGVEIKDGAILRSIYYKAKTRQYALKKLQEDLSGKILVINAYSSNRKEVVVPMNLEYYLGDDNE